MEITQGNITIEDARWLQASSPDPNPDWQGGDTEPWVVQAVCSLVLASGQRQVLELGGYSGACSIALARMLGQMGGGMLTVMEHDAEWIPRIAMRLQQAPPSVHCEVWHVDVLEGIPNLVDRSVGVAWVDDNHDGPHVIEEIDRLIPKMATNGLILFHDVWGAYNLHHLVHYYGGLALNLPRVSNSGGLGIVQVGDATRAQPKMPVYWTPKTPEEAKDPDVHQTFGPVLFVDTNA